MNVSQSSFPSASMPPANLNLSQAEIDSLKSIGGKNDRLNEVASEFESVFLSMMLKEMRATLDTEEGGLFNGEGSDTYGGMFDMFMGQHMAESQPLGIADAIKGFLGNMPS